MTSKNSLHKSKYLHTFSQALHQTLGTAVIGLAVMVLLIPVSTSAIPDISIFNLDYTHHQMKYRLYLENLNYIVNAAVILLGVVLAISLFRFMLNRRSSDAYFALGIKRKSLLLIHSAAGIFYVAVILFIAVFASVVLNIVAFGELGYTSVAIGAGFYMFLGFLILGVISFLITALVCCMVGTIIEAATFSVVIIGGASILFYGINTLAKHLLFGNAFGLTFSTGADEVSSNLLTALAKFNPALFFSGTSNEYCAQYERYDGYVLPGMEISRLIGWVVAGVILFLVVNYALKKRKAEIAGVSGRSRILNFIVTFLLAFLGFSVVLNTSAAYGTALALIASSVVFIVLYFVLEKLQTKQLKKGIWKLPVQLGSVLLAVLILGTGGFGYSGRIPQPDSIKSVSMSYVGSPNYLGSSIGAISNGKQYYLMSSYEFTEKEDIETVIGLHKDILAGGKEKLAVDVKDFSSTTVPYDLVVRYTLNNGKELTRYYDRTKLSVLEKILALDDTSVVKSDIQTSLLSAENSSFGAAGAYQSGLVYLNNPNYTSPKQVVMTDEQRKELLACIAEDVSNQSLEDRYFPEEAPVGVIMFSRSGSQEAMSFAYNIENALVYVTPSFTRTIQYLKDTNLYQYFETEDEIESISLQAFNPYVSIVNTQTSPKSLYFIGYILGVPHEYIQTKDFETDLVLDTPERINQVAPLLRNDYFMSDGGYLAQIKIKGEDQYVYKFLPAEDAPQFVVFRLRLK